MAEFSTSIIPGEKIPLTLQLDDGSAGFFPRVRITDSENNGVDVVSLVDRGFGLYTAMSNNPMPDSDFVVAQFVVYTDNLHQNIAGNYSIEIERFDRINPDDFKGEFEQVTIGERVYAEIIDETGVISGSIIDNDKITAIVEDSETTSAVLSSEELKTKIENDNSVKGEI